MSVLCECGHDADFWHGPNGCRGVANLSIGGNTACPCTVPDFVVRMSHEHRELTIRIRKLEAFCAGPRFKMLPTVEKGAIFVQVDAMRRYERALSGRLQRRGWVVV